MGCGKTEPALRGEEGRRAEQWFGVVGRRTVQINAQLEGSADSRHLWPLSGMPGNQQRLAPAASCLEASAGTSSLMLLLK